MSVSRKEFNQLLRQVQGLALQHGGAAVGRSTGRAARKRRARQRRRTGAVPVSGPPIVPGGQPGMPAAANPRRRPTRLFGGEGQMHVSRDELCAAVTTGDSGDATLSIPFNPVKSGTNFPWLSGLATSWERIVWVGVQISWRSAVGTTTDGTVCYAMDWDPRPANYGVTRSKVVSLTPVCDHPVWQSTDGRPMSLPRGMLQSRRHYILSSQDLDDAAPGSLLVAVQGAPAKKMVGEVWVRYSVTLLGPRQAGA